MKHKPLTDIKKAKRQKKNVVGYVLGVLMHGETTKLGNEDSELNPVNYYSTSTNLHTIIMIILSLYYHYQFIIIIANTPINNLIADSFDIKIVVFICAFMSL